MTEPTRTELAEGQIAPDIVAPITGGGEFHLADHRGSWVVVYFYPRANTPG
jgi:peroxiredoxin Q/BCP